MVLLSSSTYTGVHFFYDLLCTTVLISFYDTSDIVLTLHLCNLTLEIWAYWVWVARSFSVVYLIVWLMIRISLSSIGISIDQCNSLNVVANMVIIFVSPHNKIFLCLFKSQVADRFGTLSADIDICKVFPRLAIDTLLICKARKRGPFLDINTFNWLHTRKLTRWIGNRTNTI